MRCYAEPSTESWTENRCVVSNPCMRRLAFLLAIGLVGACSSFTSDPAPGVGPAATADSSTDSGIDPVTGVGVLDDASAPDGHRPDGGGEDAAADGSVSPADDFSVTLSPPTISTTLGTTSHYTITVTSLGYAGDVALAPKNIPASWSAVIDTPTVNVAANGSIMADLAITVPSTGAATAATLGIDAVEGAQTRSGMANLAVANEFIVDIADGTSDGQHNFTTPINIKVGTKLRIRNRDTTAAHRIHGSTAGFPHQAEDMAFGAEYALTPPVGAHPFYCHDHSIGVSSATVNVN